MANPGDPWWQWPRIDNFGQIDPEGNYWKPDTNVQVPGNYPIQNILPATVTSVRQTSWGQTVVTARLDQPLNNLATHEVYQHMSSATVSPGQHIDTGTLVGFNNPDGQVPLGFSFYSGDVYGSDAGWTILQQDLAPGGAGLLNPTSFLDKAKSGKIQTSSSGMIVPTSSCSGIDIPCWWNSFILPFFEHAFLLILALVLIILGFFIIAERQTSNVARKVGVL